MKKMTCLPLLIITLFLSAQEKPRRIIKTVTLCPIDISTISTRPLNEQSSIHFKESCIPVEANATITKVGKISSDKTTLTATDTVYNYAVLLSDKLIFNIERQIGTFSIIKLWRYSDPSSDAISQYQYYKLDTSKQAFLPEKISTIKKVTLSVPEQKNYKQTRAILSNKNDGNDTLVEVDPTKNYYLVKTEELMNASEEFDYKQGALNIGIMYLPVKLRPFARESGFFDFTSQLSLGTSVAWTVKQNKRNDLTTNLVLYTGISTIKIDSASSGTHDSTYKTAQNIAAFSPALGIYWEKKGIQLGFVIGYDFPASKLQRTWVYRNMPWISITAGINLFNVTANSSNKTGTQ